MECHSRGNGKVTAFVLKQHNDMTELKRMYLAFKHRIDEQGSTQASFDLLADMQKALGSTRDSRPLYMIYWPLIPSEYQTKTCIYDQSYERTKQSTQCFHLVNITTLMTKLRAHEDKYVRCRCRNHSKNLRLRWEEFAYAEFVAVLHRQYSRLVSQTTLSPLASPYISLASLFGSSTPSSISASPASSKSWSDSGDEAAIGEGLTTIPQPDEEQCVWYNRQQYVTEHERLNYRFVVNKDCQFLSYVENDLFNLQCAELAQRYSGDAAIAAFGRENTVGLRHFSRGLVTTMDYTLCFKLSSAMMRLSSISRGTVLSLAPGEQNYTLFVADCVLKIPAKGSNTTKVYTLFVPSRNKKCM